jgi:cellular nucleic acid-binding protein
LDDDEELEVQEYENHQSDEEEPDFQEHEKHQLDDEEESELQEYENHQSDDQEEPDLQECENYQRDDPDFDPPNEFCREPRANNSQCWACGKFGHMARNCPEPAECHQCGGPHNTELCKVCYVCGRPGHLARNCTVKRGDNLR